MSLQKKPDLVRQLSSLKLSLQEWRGRRETPRRIPEEIWSRAMSAADQHGVGAVASQLGLDHARLKSKLAQRKAKALSVAPGDDVQAAFFELLTPPAPSNGLGRCVIKVGSSAGRRMRVEVSGMDLPGLVTLVREFLN